MMSPVSETHQQLDDAASSAPPPPCQVCQSNASLYRCPRCSTRTCSLRCCKLHKSQTDCNGKRDRAAFCPLSRFTDRRLASDYFFLEDVLKCGERADRFVREEMGGKEKAAAGRRKRGTPPAQEQQAAARVPVSPLLRPSAREGSVDPTTTSVESVHAGGAEGDAKGAGGDGANKRRRLDATMLRVRTDDTARNRRGGSSSSAAQSSHSDQQDWLSRHPAPLKRLVRAAADRNITLLLMSPGMVRRKANTTTYSSKGDVIRWRVEWRFHVRTTAADAAGGKGGDGGAVRGGTSTERGVDGEAGPAVVTVTVNGSSESVTLSSLLSDHLDVRPDGSNRTTRSKLKPFTSVPRSGLRILTKVLPCPASKPVYVELRPDQSLGDAIKGLTIVEFPALEIVREEDLGCFPRKIEEVEASRVDNGDELERSAVTQN